MYATIIPFSWSFDDIWLTYEILSSLEGTIKVWQIVEIPLKNKTELGLVFSLESSLPENIPVDKIKKIIKIQNENIFISDYRLELLKWISEYYFTPIHNSLNLFLPKNLKEKIKKDKLDYNKTSNYEYNFNSKINLTASQKKVLSKIEKAGKSLLFWVTWSWKTEIYIELIKQNLKTWKQSLFLVPEIILWNQLLDRVQKVFWKDVILINSTVSEAKKTKYFLDILHDKAKIILGTRSALFYPYSNLWLIIMDEEHDSSYISDNAPRYKWVETANKIADLTWCKLILASGTPSIKSMYEWLHWKYEVITLLEKFS